MERQQQLKRNKECIQAQKDFDVLTEFRGNFISNKLKKNQIIDHITDAIPYVNGKGKEIIKFKDGQIISLN